MLGKMAELIETLISWGLRTLLGVVAGLQVVRGLVTPVMDSLKRSAIGKTAGTLPGVGQCSDRTGAYDSSSCKKQSGCGVSSCISGGRSRPRDPLRTAGSCIQVSGGSGTAGV